MTAARRWLWPTPDEDADDREYAERIRAKRAARKGRIRRMLNHGTTFGRKVDEQSKVDRAKIKG